MLKTEFLNCGTNVNKKWKIMQNAVWGNREPHPQRIIENGEIKIGSKKVATALNRYYVSKI